MPMPMPTHLDHPLGVLPDGSPVLPAHGSTHKQAIACARHHPSKEEQEVAQVGCPRAVVDVPAAGRHGGQERQGGRAGRGVGGWVDGASEQAGSANGEQLGSHPPTHPHHPRTHSPAVVVELAHAAAAGAAVVRLRRLVVTAVLAVAAAIQRALAHPAAGVHSPPLQVALHRAGRPQDAGCIVAAAAAAAARRQAR